MKKLLFCALASWVFCVQSHAEINLLDARPQALPEDSAQEIYRNLAKQVRETCDRTSCTIELYSFYCVSDPIWINSPYHTCGWGLRDQFSGKTAKGIYEALVRAGFESECDKDGHCELDLIREIRCKVSNLSVLGPSYSCTVSI